MKVHYFQHVPSEDVLNIESWASERGYEISRSMLSEGGDLPEMEDFDFLMILGGEMDISDEKYPWLVKEKRFICEAMAGGKILLGICMGAQLIAEALGAEVHRNEYKEIGWFPVELTSEGQRSRIFGVLPRRFAAFHWHRDTFDIPPGAKRTAESEGCANEAFEIGKTVGIQFHLESSMSSIDYLLSDARSELVEGKFIQKSEEILAQIDKLNEINMLMVLLLDTMVRELSAAHHIS